MIREFKLGGEGVKERDGGGQRSEFLSAGLLLMRLRRWDGSNLYRRLLVIDMLFVL